MKMQWVPLWIAISGLLCGCGRGPTGVVEIRIPEEGVRSLAFVSLREQGDRPAIWTTSNLTESVQARLPVGEYRVILGFANSNYQPPTETEAGRIAATAATTNIFACGLLSFRVRSDLPDLNLEAVIIRGLGGSPTVELRNTGNTYYFFLPKPLPPGTYDAEILYSRAAGPSAIATGVVVRAEETTVVALDSGLVLHPPQEGNVTGWSLTQAGADMPWVSVRRGRDNNEPLWRRFMVPPGSYRLEIVRDPPGANPATEMVTVNSGSTLVHTPAP